MKRCTGCATEKPSEQFSSSKRGRDGLSPRCKACESAYNAARYQRDPEKYKARARAYHASLLKKKTKGPAKKPRITPETKRCSSCGVTKGRTAFYADKRTPDGLRCHCIQCKKTCHSEAEKERGRAWRAEHRSELRAQQKRQRDENNERHRERKKRWYDANPEKVRAMAKRTRATNRDKISARRKAAYKALAEPELRLRGERAAARYEATREQALARAKAWRDANPHKVSANYARRRLRISAATIQQFTLDELRQRIAVFGGRCAYCGGPHEHMDHVKPIAKGGPHCLANLRPACAKCNQKKSAKSHQHWLANLPRAKPLPLP